MSEPVRAEPVDPVEYPETDGEPMAETDVHLTEMISLIASLRHRYARDPNVYVAGNMLMYFERGNIAARFSPDVFVVLGVPKHPRRVYKLWEEPPPDFVLELSSKGTSTEDEGNKKVLCRRLGVHEYFLFDPEGDYLDPRLQGYRLRGPDYERVRPERDGGVRSEVLGVTFRLEGQILRAVDTESGVPLLRPDEEYEARAAAEMRMQQAEARADDAEARVHDAEARADDAEARVRKLEAQNARLLAQLREDDGDG